MSKRIITMPNVPDTPFIPQRLTISRAENQALHAQYVEKRRVYREANPPVSYEGRA